MPLRPLSLPQSDLRVAHARPRSLFADSRPRRAEGSLPLVFATTCLDRRVMACAEQDKRKKVQNPEKVIMEYARA
jgi:hypothetical protein